MEELTGRTLLTVPGYDKKIEFGIIIYFKYMIENSDEAIEVSTTQPETILGDTGIAIHPKDACYTHLMGKFATHPFIKGRRLPNVADSSVDRNLGTRALNLSPAHDLNNFRLCISHELEFINIFIKQWID
jgi:valyl-tRNA synthetase